jgi:hypothetical protein
MYNKEYYDKKRVDLTNRIVKKMEDTITDVGKILNSFFEDKNALVADLQEIVKKQQEEEKVEVKEVKEEKNDSRTNTKAKRNA